MYQVLYRKWRPSSFSDVSGQGHITATLKNEIKSGKISHAYIFTGSRGTGKTTCAKIFAKAVNCLNPKDGEPCNECEICRGIDDGTILDVEEIDAASNNGVDNIREIRDEVNFTPASAKYRVYIIDEVHMLSSGAFNALLKTLEEPPAHVIFILATTEIHKLPATILSRCQRFDFRRISSDDIAARIKYVAKNENIKIDDDAAVLIARLADGALRDALSMLDRCAVGEEITADLVSQIAGLTGKDNLFALSGALKSNNLAEALKTVEKISNSSADFSQLTEQLITHFRNIMIAKAVKNPSDLIVCPAEELQRYMNEAAGFEMERILEILDCFQQTCEKMRLATSKRVELEMAFIRLISGRDILNSNVKQHDLESVKISQGTLETEKVTDSKSVQKSEKDEDIRCSEQIDEPPPWDDYDAPPEIYEPIRDEKAESYPICSNSPKKEPILKEDGLKYFAKWPEVIAALGKFNRLMASTLRDSEAYEKDEDLLLIKSENPMFFELIRDGKKNKSDVKRAIAEVSGRQYRIGPLKAVTEEIKVDPMQAFLDDMKSKGINIG